VRWLSDLSALQSALLPPDTAVADWARVDLDSDQTAHVHNGRTIELPAMCADRVRAHAPDGVLIALLRRSGDVWQPMKVFDWR
jgi:tRNA pseudouridine55 synthase